MSSKAEDIERVLHDFNQYKDWTSRYTYLIALGKSLPQLMDEYKQDRYLIKGCQSKVWIHAECRNGKIFYSADSDSVIIKGIIALLIGVFSDQHPQDILDSDVEFMDEIGLKNYLSPTRSNGLTHMVNQMKQYAKENLNG